MRYAEKPRVAAVEERRPGAAEEGRVLDVRAQRDLLRREGDAPAERGDTLDRSVRDCLCMIEKPVQAV